MLDKDSTRISLSLVGRMGVAKVESMPGPMRQESIRLVVSRARKFGTEGWDGMQRVLTLIRKVMGSGIIRGSGKRGSLSGCVVFALWFSMFVKHLSLSLSSHFIRLPFSSTPSTVLVR